MKGIILAGGNGTRPYPLTTATNKQLLPVYDKPMICYSLSALMMARISDILIISTERNLPQFENLIGDESKFGLSISYAMQEEPNGLVEAFIIGGSFINEDLCALVLGYHIFYGSNPGDLLKVAAQKTENSGGATIFGYYVEDPERFRVAKLDEHGRAISVEERPSAPKRNYAVTELYFYGFARLRVHQTSRTQRTRRIGNHFAQPDVLGRRIAGCRDVWQRLRVVRRRHHGKSVRSLGIRAHHGAIARTQSVFPERNRLQQRMDFQGRAPRSRKPLCKKRIRSLSRKSSRR